MGTIHSLVVVAALASGIAAGLTAVAGRDLGGWWVGLAAGVVVATCPFAWFSGSIVATYSFDMLACPLLIILAWRARPGSWHGLGAAVALGVLSGFRQSIVQSFVILALIAVVASTRRWGRLGLTVVAGGAAVAVWLIPMAHSQPGGFTAWVHATRAEAAGAAQATSVFEHGAAGSTNLGTFAAYTVVALAPLAVLAVLAGLALGVRALVLTARGQRHRSSDPDSGPAPGVGAPGSAATGRGPGISRGQPSWAPPSSPRCCWWPWSNSPRAATCSPTCRRRSSRCSCPWRTHRTSTPEHRPSRAWPAATPLHRGHG